MGMNHVYIGIIFSFLLNLTNVDQKVLHKCFLIVLVWLIAVAQHLKRANWWNLYCHMIICVTLIILKELPLPGDLKYVWLDIKKVIKIKNVTRWKQPKAH